jgi:hypothetical protein
LFAGTAVAAFAVSPPAAQASPIRSTPTAREAHFSGDLLKQSGRQGNLLAGSDKQQTHLHQFLDRESREGRLLNDSDVTVTTLPDPFRSGRTVDVAWSGARPPADVALQWLDDGKAGGAQAIGVKPAVNDAIVTSAPGVAAGGSGYDTAVSPSNMYRQNNGCVTVWFNAAYSSQDHQLVSCFEKWAQPGTNHWIYNRWGLWTRATDPGGYAETREFTVRSRPWKGQESRLTQLNSWQPAGPSSTCQELGALKIGGTYSGVTGEISVPIRTCSNTILKVDPSTRMIGIGIEGSESGRQMRVDVAGDYKASNSSVVPTWADYTWVQVDYCPQPFRCHEYWLNKESGW